MSLSLKTYITIFKALNVINLSPSSYDFIKYILIINSTYFYGEIFKFILCWAKFIFPDFHGGSNYCTADKNISSLSYRYNELDE